MTFTGKLLRLDEMLVSIALAQLSGADGTAAFLTAGAGAGGRGTGVVRTGLVAVLWAEEAP